MTSRVRAAAGPDLKCRVRPAAAADVEPVAALFLACWRSYSSFLPRSAIDAFDEARAVELWRRAIAEAPAGESVLVADDRELGVVGIVRFGTDPDEKGAGHVFSLYVHPATHGLGIGRALMRRAAAGLRRSGMSGATLWVFAANERARSFYERAGWRPDGATRVEAGFGEPEVRLRRGLHGAGDRSSPG